MTEDQSLSARELAILLHTLGLSDPYRRDSYRNHYCASAQSPDLPTFQTLCDRGLMEERHPPAFVGSDYRLFAATAAGKAAALRERQRPTSAQRRYHRYLEIQDCWQDLSFKEFLTSPRFREER